VEKVKPEVIAVWVKMEGMAESGATDDELSVPPRSRKVRRVQGRQRRPPRVRDRPRLRLLQVTADDGKAYSAKVIGTDQRTDNAAIFSPSGGSVGIAFDIPAETVKSVAAQLRDKGTVTRGWIGVQIQPVTRDIADSLGLKEAAGSLVSEPEANSPAAKAGIASGSVIMTLYSAAVRDRANSRPR
jgi:S1-C subfamily serine protease